MTAWIGRSRTGMAIAAIALAGIGLIEAPDLIAATTPISALTRKVVLEKDADKYAWKLIAAPVPVVGDHQVLVHVRAVAINRGDLDLLNSVNPQHDLTGRQVASDAAGDVVAVGKLVTQVRVGARVTSTHFRNWTDGAPTREQMMFAHGFAVDGVLADYVALDDTAVIAMPPRLSYEEAATLPTAGLTGWMASVGMQPLRPTDVVLIQGTGGVSIFALQFAAAAGAHLILTSSSDGKLARAQRIAKHDSINYHIVPAWSVRVRELSGGHGANLVIDVGGTSTLPESLKSLAIGGRLSLVGDLTGYDGQISAYSAISKLARIQGVYVGSRADFQRMNAFILARRLHPVIDRVFPLEQFQAALDYVTAGDFIGKVVLSLDPGTSLTEPTRTGT
jgi:NADPH:quinone reductase-like Zn-dependent oxidoreductase